MRALIRMLKDVTAGDAHTPTALGNEGRRKPTNSSRAASASVVTIKGEEEALDKSEWSVTADIIKYDDEQRVVWGWASVVSEKGQTVTDRQGDQIDVADLIKAAHEFVTESRVGGEMHDVMGTGHVVESIVFTDDLQKVLGIDLGKVGWFIGMKITDDAVWKRVKKGELRAFSFGGRAIREDV